MNPNSMLNWLPVVEALGIPSPRTFLRPVADPTAWWGWADGDGVPSDFKALLGQLGEDAATLGYPVFVRTDLCSGKHSWLDSCYVPDAESLEAHVLAVVEWTFLGPDEPPAAIAVREFLPLESKFAAFNGLPIAVERRVFADSGVVLCEHFYWPEMAFDDRHHEPPLPENWRGLLRNMSELQPGEFSLCNWAEEVTARLGGAWSVDFSLTADGRGWMLIDMALAAESWHPEDCPMRASTR